MRVRLAAASGDVISSGGLLGNLWGFQAERKASPEMDGTDLTISIEDLLDAAGHCPSAFCRHAPFPHPPQLGLLSV